MGAGRPSDGLKHVTHLTGPREGKKRLRWILSSMMNQCTVSEACEALHIRPARFHQLRRKALAGALHGLSPGSPGRPPGQGALSDESVKVQNLKERVKDLEIRLDVADVQGELQSVTRAIAYKKNSIGRK